MKLVTPQQMRQIDRTAINRLGIPGIVLMENAAIQVAMKASAMLKGKEEACVTVVAGSGNNGGDAFAATRHLLSMGYSVSVFAMSPPEQLEGDALTNARILMNMGLDITTIRDETSLLRLGQSCRQSDLVIDGLLGTGLNRNADGLWLRAIDTMNAYSKTILSIDIASGIDGLSGKVMGSCIKADATVTFFLPKTGMVQYPGASYTGELTVADIGIPYALADDFDTIELSDPDMIKGMLPNRPDDGHKGTFGKVLIVGGSQGMTGAPYLSASAAYRCGSGLVKLAVAGSCLNTLSILLPEAVYVTIPENGTEKELCLLFRQLLQEADAVLVGPGLSVAPESAALVKSIVEVCEKPVVFDADGLNIIAGNKSLLEELRCEAVLTPHPAEMARLIGSTPDEVQSDRIETARRFADEYGVTVVLKGAGTIISANDGRTAVNPTGNSGMATAGSGDVLAGVIASLLGQGLPPFESAVAGAYLHGLAGDFAARDIGKAGMMASDIVGSLPRAFSHILGKN